MLRKVNTHSIFIHSYWKNRRFSPYYFTNIFLHVYFYPFSFCIHIIRVSFLRTKSLLRTRFLYPIIRDDAHLWLIRAAFPISFMLRLRGTECIRCIRKPIIDYNNVQYFSEGSFFIGKFYSEVSRRRSARKIYACIYTYLWRICAKV